MKRILVIDDDEIFLATIERVLKKHGYDVKTAANGFQALEIVRAEHFDLIISDVRMPGMDGIETLKSVQTQSPATRKIVVTGFASDSAPVQAIKLGVDDYLNKPFEMHEFLEAVRRSLSRSDELAKNETSSAELQRKYNKLIQDLIVSMEKDDTHFHDHAKRVSTTALDIGRKMGLTSDRLDMIKLAAMLHDIGMISIKESVLEKSEPLEEQERDQIRKTPLVVRELIGEIEGLRPVLPVIYHIHEKVDGTGYPDGISSSDIPLESRIIAVAEAFVSLTSPRPYREAVNAQKAVDMIEEERNSRFDESVIGALKDMMGGDECGPEDRQVPEKGTARTFWSLARLYFHSGNLELALSAIDEGLRTMPETTMDPSRISLLAFRTRILMALDRGNEALECAQEALKSAKKMGDLLATAGAFLVIASVWRETGKYQEAGMALGKALDLYEKWGDDIERLRARLHHTLLLLCRAHREGSADSQPDETVEEVFNAISQCDAWSVLHEEGPLFVPLITSGLRSGRFDEPLKKVTEVLLAHYPDEVLKAFMEGSERQQEFIVQVLRQAGGQKGRDALLILSRSPIESIRRNAGQALDALNQNERPLLEVSCFGRFSLLLGGRPVDESMWQTRHAKHLFIFLAMNAGKSFPDDRLMDLFWRDSPADKAKQNLLTTITRIKNVFRKNFADCRAEEYVVREQDYLAFNSDANFWIDFRAFEKCLDEARHHEGGGNMQKAMVEYQKAQRLYSGPLLEGIYEDWVFQKREELQEKYLEALVRLSTFYLERDNTESALKYSRMILDEDPLSSQGITLIMKLLTKQGKRDLAARKYHDYAKKMDKEMGLKPDPEVMRVYMSLIEARE
jgi:putative two-component system response regulator